MTYNVCLDGLPRDEYVFCSLPEAFAKCYIQRFTDFVIYSNEGKFNFSFNFPREWFAGDSMSISASRFMYDSFFYTYVSMYLTRDERDEFIKLIRGE